MGPERLPRVLVVNPSPDLYGADLQVLQSITAMRARGWQVLVALPEDGPLVPRLQQTEAGVMFIRFPVLRRANQSAVALASMAAAAAAAVPRLVVLLRRLKPDAVYVNTVTLPWWLAAARVAGVPVVCHLHEAENTDNVLVRRALISPLRLANAVLVISGSAMSAMLDAEPGLGGKARLIYNGVPGPPDEPQPARRGAPVRVVTVGRLSPRKAPHLTLEAVALLRREGLDVDVTLVGTAFAGYEWYERELLARMAEPDLAGHGSLAGYQSPIWPVFAAADIVVQPSLREPFGNAVVEAQMSLRPVVATAALGHLESISDDETGLLVPAEDVPAMAAAIRRLIEDDALERRLTAGARTTAYARFGTQRYGAEVVSLLSAVMGRVVPAGKGVA